MTFFGPSSRLERTESPDVLEFRIVPVLRGFHLLLAGLVAGVIATYLMGFLLGLLAAAAVSGGWYLAKRKDSRPRVLRVTETTLEAFGRYQPERLLWSKVMRLEYSSGGEYDPSGLAAKTGRWTWVWLVRDVSQREAAAMADTIFRRFPFVTMAPEPPSLLAGWLGKDKSSA